MTAHTCNLCDWYTQEPREPVAQAQSTWHVYRKHPEAWRKIIGDRPPVDPDPDTPQELAMLTAVPGLN